MTESKRMITSDLKGVIYVPFEEDNEVLVIERFKPTPVIENEPELIEKKRALRRWKQSFGYYCLHPEKFGFRLRDLK